MLLFQKEQEVFFLTVCVKCILCPTILWQSKTIPEMISQCESWIWSEAVSHILSLCSPPHSWLLVCTECHQEPMDCASLSPPETQSTTQTHICICHRWSFCVCLCLCACLWVNEFECLCDYMHVCEYTYVCVHASVCPRVCIQTLALYGWGLSEVIVAMQYLVFLLRDNVHVKASPLFVNHAHAQQPLLILTKQPHDQQITVICRGRQSNSNTNQMTGPPHSSGSKINHGNDGRGSAEDTGDGEREKRKRKEEEEEGEEEEVGWGAGLTGFGFVNPELQTGAQCGWQVRAQ